MKAAEMTVQDYRVKKAVKAAIKKLFPWLVAMSLEIYEQGRQDGREEQRRPD